MSVTRAIVDLLRKSSPKPSALPKGLGAVRQGRVLVVYATGLMVEYEGKSGLATQATDEPMSAGTLVWVIESANGGIVVLGSVK